MSLEYASEYLGWPRPKAILEPQGAAPRVLTQIARQKIEQALLRQSDGIGVQVGVLTRDPTSDNSEEPIAIVCAFQKPVPLTLLTEAHRLAWNFCRSRLLLLVEPHLVRAWTCCEPPPKSSPQRQHPAEIDDNPLGTVPPSATEQATQSLSWIQLISGEFFEKNRDRFSDAGRADRTLLENLRHVRTQLTKELHPDIAHDLLARLIFIQFLFDRTDSRGQAALSSKKLKHLHEQKTLSKPHNSLAELLRNKNDAYNLFRWLNERFNGDLFPGKGDTPEEREASWLREETAVHPEHLRVLADFIDGSIELEAGQHTLWRMYAFDVIPLEFISSIYEEFAGAAKGVHYTPAYLVDFVLDGVLPWNSKEWDLKILDPACGSGIFLVKSFQRLVYRWHQDNPDKELRADVLQRLLDRNLFGVDTDRHAVRAASFSLYLAMCDAIDPRHYWTQIRFPLLRDRRLVHGDFFEERDGFDSTKDTRTYDLVVGNAPWGEESISETSQTWAKKHNWLTPNKSIGPLFLAKAAEVTKEEGRISMLQPANTLLLNRGTATELRERLFKKYQVEEIVNLAALRFQLFNRKTKKAKPTICIVTFRPTPPDGSALTYICPKPQDAGPTDAILIEPQDVHQVELEDAISEPWVWTALLWGGPRDLELLQRLRQRPSLAKVIDKHHRRVGIMRGGGERQPSLLDRRILETPDFPPGTFLRLRATDLPNNKDDRINVSGSKRLEPFDAPQLVICRSYSTVEGRFSAALVEPDPKTGGAICKERYVSVHATKESAPYLEAACLGFNSLVAAYFLLLTGRKAALFNQDAQLEELLETPIPEPQEGLLKGVNNLKDLDKRARQAYRLRDSDWALIEDFAKYTAPLIRAAGSTGYSDLGSQRHLIGLRDSRKSDAGSLHPELQAYCKEFVSILREGGGTQAGATIFRPDKGTHIPLLLVAIHMSNADQSSIQEEAGNSQKLWDTMAALSRKLSPRSAKSEGVFFRRGLRVYDVVHKSGRPVPTVYIAKPPIPRYWTRSAALRDADEVMAEALASHSRERAR